MWDANRSTDRLTLLGRLDYRRGLTQQFPPPAHRVVYSKGGMYLAAARVSDSSALIDHKLYWAAASGIEEARYLTAILNSDVLTQLVRPLQARGEHNPRDFDKYVFRLPIPLYNPDNSEHRQLVELATSAPRKPPPLSNCQLGFPSRRNGAAFGKPYLAMEWVAR